MKKDDNNTIPKFYLSKDESSFRDFLGARKETILRLGRLYQDDYFANLDSDELIKKRKKMYAQEFERIKKYFDLSKGGSILDIGCSSGEFLNLFDKNWKKYGIDISAQALENARKSGIIVDFDFQDKMFDLIIFRGTIQHIPDPISRIEKCYYWLKDNGGLIFLVTPNTNSIYYKLFNDLPLLDNPRNFFIPSDIILKRLLSNFGFTIKGSEFPYRGTPYASPARDLFNFILKALRIKKNIKVPFYKNIMEIYAQKSN